jgi:catechol 2,3-dioxygenase-like lactoylglutathione lyase family enzyme
VVNEPSANEPIHVARANTILYCTKWTETVAFYRATLGLAVTFENDWFVEFRVADTSMLSIADVSRATIRAVEGQGITLTWQVVSTHAVRDVLRSRGVEVTALTERFGATVCYFHDPEGHRVELWAPRR